MTPRRDVDRSQPPPTTTVRDFVFPEFSTGQLANGLQVLYAQRSRFPLAVVEYVAPAGGKFEGACPGLATLHAGLLDEGTERMSALDIAGRTEQLGGYLGSGANWDIGFVNTTCLASNLQAGMELVAEVCRMPTFPEEEIERARKQRLAEILRRQNQPNHLADLVFSKVVYNDTVYAHPLIGSTESVESLQSQDFTNFYQRHLGVEGGALIAAGDFSPERFLKWAESTFGDWALRSAPVVPPIASKPLSQTEVHIVDRPGSSQTRLQLGHSGMPRNHPDFEKFLLLNSILGGKFTSRINLNLREEHGYTYGANSRMLRRRETGPFTITTSVKTEVTGDAVGQLLYEVRRIRQEPVEAEELRETCDYLIGAFPYTLQSIDDVAQRLEDLVVFDLPTDLYEGYPASLVNVTQEDILEAAQRYLDPDHIAIVAVGAAEALAPQLEAYGPIKVWKI